MASTAAVLEVVIIAGNAGILQVGVLEAVHVDRGEALQSSHVGEAPQVFDVGEVLLVRTDLGDVGEVLLSDSVFRDALLATEAFVTDVEDLLSDSVFRNALLVTDDVEDLLSGSVFRNALLVTDDVGEVLPCPCRGSRWLTVPPCFQAVSWAAVLLVRAGIERPTGALPPAAPFLHQGEGSRIAELPRDAALLGRRRRPARCRLSPAGCNGMQPHDPAGGWTTTTIRHNAS